MPRTGGPEIVQRSLGSRHLHGHLLVDATITGPLLRAFFGTGTPAAAFSPDGAPGHAVPQDLRETGGGTLAVLPAAGPHRIALADGGSIALAPAPDETALFAGLNTVLALRLDEPAPAVAEGLRYHARHHGLEAALLVNRLPAPDFAAALAAALAGTDLRIVIVDCPLPLGRPDAGPESHPHLAPDAPGRAQMAPPPCDPWRSPLAEGIVVEALRWRFLARARAVMHLDVTDILAAVPPGDPSAFDLCRDAPSGTLLLVGRRIYPWRVRAGQPARFGDHVCRPFDARRGIARWVVAPDRASPEAIWRPTRIAGARPDPARARLFFRAMAIRVPGVATARLAPRAALVEDPALVALATGPLGHRPIRPPRSAPKPQPATGRTAIVTAMKNEGPFILEWLAWHRAIGVQDVLVYTNDCTDGTDTLLDVLAERGLVQHRANPFRAMNLKPQHAALRAAEDEPLMRAAEWAIAMDVDEFLNIRIGDGTLAALYAAMEAALPGANLISATWRLFGNAGIHAYEDRFVTEQFTRCAPRIIRKPHQAWGFKTLFRTIDIYRKLGVHRPKGLRPDRWTEVRWLNGAGRPMPATMFRNGWRSTTRTFGDDWVQLNHYATRSAESFLVKRDRGRVNHVDRDQGLNYWFRMNHNAEHDPALAARLPRLAAEHARLMADPAIAAAHAATVAAHRDRIAALRATPGPAAFYAELTSPRMERLCRLQHHFGAAVFAAGPGAIPAALLAGDLPADFFFTLDPAAARPAAAR